MARLVVVSPDTQDSADALHAVRATANRIREHVIERYVTDLNGQPVKAVAALGAASPGPERASCALRLFGRADVTKATRWVGRSMDHPFTILGLIS